MGVCLNMRYTVYPPKKDVLSYFMRFYHYFPRSMALLEHHMVWVSGWFLDVADGPPVICEACLGCDPSSLQLLKFLKFQS